MAGDAVFNFGLNQWQTGSDEHSIVVNPGDPGTSGTVTLFTFPKAGTLESAYLNVDVALGGGTVNYYTFNLQSGTAIVAAALGGTAGLTVGAHAFAVTNPFAFAAGAAITTSYVKTGTITPAVDVQLDYQLDNSPGL